MRDRFKILSLAIGVVYAAVVLTTLTVVDWNEIRPTARLVSPD